MPQQESSDFTSSPPTKKTTAKQLMVGKRGNFAKIDKVWRLTEEM
jgi:hypothetical protein